jgi:hypothetical protein
VLCQRYAAHLVPEQKYVLRDVVRKHTHAQITACGCTFQGRTTNSDGCRPHGHVVVQNKSTLHGTCMLIETIKLIFISPPRLPILDHESVVG